MIYKIYSDLPKFKNLDFKSGLNILLADKSKGATDKQTRNSAGKTSLIEIINFLFGGNCNPDSIFRTQALVGHTFKIDFDLAGGKTSIGRTGTKHNEIFIYKGDFDRWPITPKLDKKTGFFIISNTDWKSVLGELYFNLSSSNDKKEKYKPTFRSLFGYLLRRQNSGGFQVPEMQNGDQELWDVQVAVSFLLNLDWTIPQKWQGVRIREKTIRELKKALEDGSLGTIIKSSSDLRTELAIVSKKIEKLKETLSTFKVVDEYHDLENEASLITRNLGILSDQNTSDRQLILNMEESLKIETPPTPMDLESIYQEVGILLNKNVKKRIEDVREFHNSVIENRKAYLNGEITSCQNRIAAREQEMKKLDTRRSEIMLIMKSAGALEQFTELQNQNTKLHVEEENLKQQYETVLQLESQKTELDIERSKLLIQLRADYKERNKILQNAINNFEDISTQLYGERSGSLNITETPNGPQFGITIHGGSSRGINNMQIFCFDLLIMKLLAERKIGPQILIHDSHLFDGVDERQVIKAIKLGEKLSNDLRFQYIITMNSDALPTELKEDKKISDCILPTRLLDTVEDGGIFGTRFN